MGCVVDVTTDLFTFHSTAFHGFEQVLAALTGPERLIEFDQLDKLLVNRDNGLFPSFPFPEPDESFVQQ